MKTALKIPAIAGNVHLGCTAQERARKQRVQLQIEVYFSKTPRMLTSDNIEDGPCYAEMTAVVQKAFAKKHYATIEHLCFECHQDLQKYLKQWKSLKKSRLITTLLKLHPPVKEITAGSVFTIEDKI
jgi:dihydroneopterin aldolase